MIDIINNVNSYLVGDYPRANYNFQKVLDENSKYNNLEKYKLQTAIRLIKCIVKYDKGIISACDLLCSLRNYLLVFKLTVSVSNKIKTEIRNHENQFGLRLDAEERVYAVLDMIEHVGKNSYIETAFMGDNTQSGQGYDDRYFLGTSPYINALTSFKYYKSIEQKLAVSGALTLSSGSTALISLPTGGGKSLITQSVAYMEKGLTVVIVPTVSLALDQVRAAKVNIKHDTSHEVYCYYSGTGDEKLEQIINDIDSNTTRILFTSPEALIKNAKLGNAIDRANKEKRLKNIIIDEAHIVIEWGAFFRVDYQCLEAWRKRLIYTNRNIRTFLLSATFEKKTVESLKLMFSGEDRFVEIRCDALRKEPRFIVIEAKSRYDKKRKVIELIEKLPRPIIVYVLSPDDAENLKLQLIDIGYKNIVTFTSRTTSIQREKIIMDWSNNEFDIVIATSAFGVGVDKSDVRTVLHLYIPENPNKYYQELGRGGRDGLPSLSVMCIEKEGDLAAAFSMIDKVITTEKLVGRWFSMLESPTSKRLDERILLDTSVKPNYNIDEDFKMEIENDLNKKNMQWNIYVILLLRRYKLIGINDMIYDRQTGVYYININIINYEIYNDSQASKQLLNEIREKEWSKFESDFKVIRNAINNVELFCWSEMFYETYDLVSEYCAGCIQHSEVEYTDVIRFPLVKKIGEIVNDAIGIKTLFPQSKEVQIYGDSNDISIIRKLVEMGVRTIVIDENSEKKFIDILLNLSEEINVNFMGTKEFDALVNMQEWYYLSGNVLIIYGEGYLDSHCEMLLITRKLVGQENIRVFHLLNQDVYVKQFGKNASDVINGPHIAGYIVESMEVNDV
ncbi:helicase-related protein [Ruminiclostridium papyrosolvens DSM 2782]|nr:DEAD/DEAH box helicase [Ruminiclostridium papyrosolvens]WES33853.1 helicase-related protein [Ruminiclostridium papyrosolvens DSM 2782]